MKSLVVIASIHSPEHERLLTAADREYLEKLSSPKRRAEVAAWRAIVRREMGDVTIGYNEVGAPVISVEAEELLCTAPDVAASRMVGAAKDMATGVAKGSATGTTTNAVKWMHISVSHSGEYVAVIFSCGRCAIDIENVSRNYNRAEEKFITQEEQSIEGSDNPLFKAAVWCARETLYKFSGRTGLSLLADLQISAIDFSGMQNWPSRFDNKHATADAIINNKPTHVLQNREEVCERSGAFLTVVDCNGVQTEDVVLGGRLPETCSGSRTSEPSSGIIRFFWEDFGSERVLIKESGSELFLPRGCGDENCENDLTGGRITGAIRSPQGEWENCEMQMILYGGYLVVFTA